LAGDRISVVGSGAAIMQITRSKIVALVIALGYLAAAFFAAGLNAVPSVGISVMLPLVLIWFPKKMGAAPTKVDFSGIDTETPAIVVTAIGWVWLLGYLPLLAYLLAR
jgi:xanthine/uracil/vitamin C permease (AzgA family)